LAEFFWVILRSAATSEATGAALQVQKGIGAFLFGPYAAASEAVTLLMLIAGLALVSEKRP
jgi:hypothetical protein